MYSIPNSSNSKYRLISKKHYTPLETANSHKSLKNDLQKYDDLIKKARETINQFNPNYRSKSRIRGNFSSNSNIIAIRNFQENKNYSFLQNRFITSSRDSKDDIHNELSRTQDIKNDVEDYYKTIFSKLKNDNNIQNEKIFKLESINKQNELDLIDNEKERNKLKNKVKSLENKLNESNQLYDELKRQKENIENSYEQLKYDYKKEKKKSEFELINKNKFMEDSYLKENEMLKIEVSKYIKENINLKLKVKTLKNKLNEINNSESSNLLTRNQSKLQESKSNFTNKSEKIFNDDESLKSQLEEMKTLYNEQME